MTTFITPSQSPTIGALSVQCDIQKGLPIGWYREDPVVTIISQTDNTFVGSASLGEWKYRECLCEIDCQQTADVEVQVPPPVAGDPPASNWVKLPKAQICPSLEDFVFAARINNPSTTSPTDFLLTFTDVFGNTRKLPVSIVKWTVPKVPSAALESIADPGTQFEPGQKLDTKRVTVTIPVTSSDDTDISTQVSAYQVRRYVSHSGVNMLLRDWQKIEATNTALDFLVQGGKEYGYSVRYRASIGDETAWSPWAVVNT